MATASYRLLPVITLKEEIQGQDAEELVAKCPLDVFDIEDMGGGSKRAKVRVFFFIFFIAAQDQALTICSLFFFERERSLRAKVSDHPLVSEISLLWCRTFRFFR